MILPVGFFGFSFYIAFLTGCAAWVLKVLWLEFFLWGGGNRSVARDELGDKWDLLGVGVGGCDSLAPPVAK